MQPDSAGTRGPDPRPLRCDRPGSDVGDRRAKPCPHSNAPGTGGNIDGEKTSKIRLEYASVLDALGQCYQLTGKPD